MSSYASKPENALRRAEQLISISQKEQALSVLHNVLSVRRHRTWSPIYETIMISYLDLCSDLNKTREAKDGLHQYRNLAQSQAPGSLEIVIRHLVDKSEALCKEAKLLAEQSSDAAPIPLDTATSTTSGTTATTATSTVSEEEKKDDSMNLANESNMLLLSTMSTDPAQSQRDTALLLPKLKFTWEAYRAVLDILKSNSKLERLYHLTAIGALEFCATYKRRTEFRRLCDLLRIHLGNLQKYGGVSAMAKVEEGGKPNNKVRGWEGWTAESIELHLQTRFSQLETASTLKLYTEGFRTVEDIFNILQTTHSRRKGTASLNSPPPPPKAKLMAAYYEKLTTLFWVSENYLFHAFAWYKFYTLCKEFNRGMTSEQKRMQASAVVLAALCIPTLPTMTSTASNDKISQTVQDDIAKEKTARMATLLGFHTRNPTREALLAEIKNKNVMGNVPDYICELYKLLEGNVNPLVLVQKAKPLLEKLRQEAGVTSTSTNTTTESKEEEEEFNTLSAYVEPLISVLLLKLFHALSASYHTISLQHIQSLTSDLGVSFESVEKIIVTAATSKSNVQLQARIDYRSNSLRFGDAALTTTSTNNESSNTQGHVLESNAMRSQLSTLARQLSTVCTILDPPNPTVEAQARSELYSTVRSQVDVEHDAMLARKDLIESRKEEVERQANLKLKEEELKRLEAQANARAEEEKRLAREQQLREQEKLNKIKRELELSEKKNYLKAMGQNVEIMSEEELMAFDIEALAKEHATKAAKKKDDAERKVRELQKKLDYVVRAIRIEEEPIIKKRYEDQVKTEKERYEADIIEQARKNKLKWEADCEEKANLSKFSVFDYMNEFEDLAMVGREAVHQTLCQEEDARAEEIAEKFKLQRARARKDEEIRMQKEEEERIKREEEELKAKEEQERREEERRKKEEEDALRRKKEEDRMAAERERKARESAPAPPSKDLDKASGSGGGGGSYLPPSRRSLGGGSGGDSSYGRSGGGGNSWADRGRGYGGGRYDGGERGGGGGGSRFSDREGGERSGGGGGGGSRFSDRFGDRDGGERGGGGGGSRFSDRFGDREGGERGGGGGGSRYNDRYGSDRGNDRNDSRYGGDRGGDRDGDRSYGRRRDDRGGDPPRTNSRWGRDHAT